jgi:hypothetical protein
MGCCWGKVGKGNNRGRGGENGLRRMRCLSTLNVTEALLILYIFKLSTRRKCPSLRGIDNKAKSSRPKLSVYGFVYV